MFTHRRAAARSCSSPASCGTTRSGPRQCGALLLAPWPHAALQAVLRLLCASAAACRRTPAAAAACRCCALLPHAILPPARPPPPLPQRVGGAVYCGAGLRPAGPAAHPLARGLAAGHSGGGRRADAAADLVRGCRGAAAGGAAAGRAGGAAAVGAKNLPALMRAASTARGGSQAPAPLPCSASEPDRLRTACLAPDARPQAGHGGAGGRGAGPLPWRLQLLAAPGARPPAPFAFLLNVQWACAGGCSPSVHPPCFPCFVKRSLHPSLAGGGGAGLCPHQAGGQPGARPAALRCCPGQGGLVANP